MKPFNLTVTACDCTTECRNYVESMIGCVRFTARTRGPISTAPCLVCCPDGETWHAADGGCLYCEEAAMQPPESHMVG